MEIGVIGDTFYSFVAVRIIKIDKIGKFIEELRDTFQSVSLQALDANIIFGIEHIDGVLKITLESINRKITISNKAEIDLLLRLSFTNQISLALKYGGLKNGFPGCLIFFSKDRKRIEEAKSYLEQIFFDIDNSVIDGSDIKRKAISERIGISSNKILDEITFVRYLIERASLIIR